MKEKYIDEKMGVWIVFGKNPQCGYVDVADQHGDVFTHVSPSAAKALIEAQEEFRNKVYEILRYY